MSVELGSEKTIRANHVEECVLKACFGIAPPKAKDLEEHKTSRPVKASNFNLTQRCSSRASHPKHQKKFRPPCCHAGGQNKTLKKKKTKIKNVELYLNCVFSDF